MRLEVPVRGVTPDAAWAWWTDFRNGTEDHDFWGWARPERRVEEREDGSLLITDTARVLGMRYLEVCEAMPAKPRLRFDARNNFGRFRGHYRFLPGEGGTRLEVAWEQELVPWLRAFGPVGRWLVRRMFAWDLRHHARALEHEAGPREGP